MFPDLLRDQTVWTDVWQPPKQPLFWRAIAESKTDLFPARLPAPARLAAKLGDSVALVYSSSKCCDCKKQYLTSSLWSTTHPFFIVLFSNEQTQTKQTRLQRVEPAFW